jgi:hypothetical protein
MSKAQERLAVFIFGVLFAGIMLAVAIWVPHPTPTQYETFKVILALAAAGIAAFIPGFLQVSVPRFVRAGGALGVFVFIYMRTPAQMIVNPAPPPPITWHAAGRVMSERNGRGVPAAEIRVSGDASAFARSQPDGSFGIDVHASPGMHVLFRVKTPGHPEFTKWIPVGSESVELWESGQP